MSRWSWFVRSMLGLLVLLAPLIAFAVPVIASVTLTPNPAGGGSSVNAVVNLNSKAPAGGFLVKLSSQNPAATVPATVLVDANATFALFTVTTSAVSVNTVGTIKATDPANNSVFSPPLTIQPIAVRSLTVSPISFVGSTTAVCAVRLNAPAPAGGYKLNISTTNAAAIVPAVATVPAGTSSVVFNVGSKAVAGNTTGRMQTVSPSGVVALSAIFTILPLPTASLTLSASSVVGPDPVTGTVTLSGPAPTGGQVLLLTSENSAATVPAKVTVAAGATTATFTVTTQPVATNATGRIKAVAANGLTSYSPSLAVTIDPLLDDISHRAFQFFWNNSNSLTGLTKDRASNFGTDGYNVASIASTGFALSSYAIGAKRGWVSQANALARTRLTLNFLASQSARQKGWFYHFVDWSTGARVWNSEVSSIDTSILVAGMLMAQTYFNDAQVNASASSILGSINWSWMLTDDGTNPAELTYNLGWTPENGFLPYRWSVCNEEEMLYIQGLGASPSIPSGTWTAFSRPTVTYDGYTSIFAGPLFQHEMSHGFLEFSGKRDSLGWDYWVSARNAILSNRKYCYNNPLGFVGYGSTIWGITACDTPTGYAANGAPNYYGNKDDGTLAPTAAIAGLPYTPTESRTSAYAFKSKYPASYGNYGFSNGLNPTKNWIDADVIGIDLGMAMLGIENYKDNTPHNLSMANSVNATGMNRAGFHVTSEGSLNLRKLFVAPAP